MRAATCRARPHELTSLTIKSFQTLKGVGLSHNSLTDKGCPPVKEKREVVGESWARADGAATVAARTSPGGAYVLNLGGDIRGWEAVDSFRGSD